MKKLTITIAALAASALALVGVALAQDNWIPPLVREYSAVWLAAYDEAGKHNLPTAGQEAVAERVLDAHIATQTAATANNGVIPTPVLVLPTSLPTATPGPVATSELATPGPYGLPPPAPADAATTVSLSDVDGYITIHEIEITTSGQLLMTTSNFHTAGAYGVMLTYDGTLTTGGSGTIMEDRYSYSCAVASGVLWDETSYASDAHSVDLPKTVLDTDPLFSHQTAVLGMQVCTGEQEPSSEPIVTVF